MKLSEFIDEYREAISERVIESFKPLYHPSESTSVIPKLLRRPMGNQGDAIRGAALSMENTQGTIIVGEMGTGKTFIGAAAAHMAGFQRVLVLCPPHLTKKWKREVEETIPGVHSAIVGSMTDLDKIQRIPTTPLFVIMSREKAKLGYRWKSAVNWRFVMFGGKLALDEETGEAFEGPYCPTCASLVVDDDGIPMTTADLEKKKQCCPFCKGPLWTADNTGPRRYPLADYVKSRMKNFFDLLIADEVHEYKGRGSAQGIAAGILADVCKTSLMLTGTLTGGYSSTLFHLLYRFTPAIRGDFKVNEEGRWVKKYGFIEERHKAVGGSDFSENGRISSLKKYKKTTKEKPGLMPTALTHLINNSVFLRLSDVSKDLPPYTEQIILNDLDSKETPEEDWTQRSAYQAIFIALRELLKDQLLKGSKKMLSTYLQTLLAYPDGCTRGETVFHPETGNPVIAVPPLNKERIYPKEEQLLNLVKEEKAKGRKVLVYVTHTGTRDITGRIAGYLKDQDIQTKVLKADTVSPDKREAWVAEQMTGSDVLICHPRLVQTGLDLIDFPTIVWFETDYSVYTMRQASRRSWRIGQKNEVKVVFFAYRHTIQADALMLVAKKMASSLAVEGELPEEGLSAYGDDGDDVMMTLVKQIVGEQPSANTALIEEVFQAVRQNDSEAEEFLIKVTEKEPELEVLPDPEEEIPFEPIEVKNGNGNGNGHHEEEEPMSWTEFLVASNKTNTLSLFEWAMTKEKEPV